MSFDLLNPLVDEYLHDLVPPRVAEMKAMEAYAERENFPIIGPVVGQLCYLIARLINARRIFELGSGYGYSTAWFTRAVQENGGGQVYHTVWDEKLSQMARRHLGALGYNDLVQYRVSEAVQALQETPGPFDLIFSDINKDGYPDSLPAISEKLRSGGALIVDNMILGGRIFDGDDDSSSVEGVQEFTRLITGNPEWIPSVIPIRDGVLLAQKA
jgi:predicted O-methyltransferase YrrM